ncbi:unnamed protein product, partial [Mesorhabditis spiculigera]
MVTGPLRNHSNIGPISSGAVVLLLVSLVSLAAGAPQINAQKTTSLLVDEEPDPEHIGAQQAPRSINVITIQKEPAISGARVEALTTEHEPVFLGHTARGESIVVPDSLIQYSLYGFWLDEVLEIGFTTKTCIEPEYSFDREVFGYQSDKRITLHASFGSHDRELRLCVKHRPKDRVTKPEFDEVAEARTWISTLPAPRKYYFPFPVQMNAKDENGLPDELRIAVGAMEISDKTVSDVMTRIDDVFMLHNDTVLNTKAVAEILRMGYTRIPIYSGDRNNVVSLLFVKDLALLDPDDNFTIQMVTSYHKHPLRFVMEDTPLRIMLEEFKRGDYHLAMVQRVVEKDEKDPTYDLVGVVTLEDIVEEILQAEIVDETDAVTDNVFKHRRRGAQATDLSYLCSNEEPSKLSVQMQLVTMQWLTTNHALAFSSEVIASPVLEKLIRQQVRRVELSHLPDMYDPKAVIPRTAKIFTKGEFSDRFVLILEGRALVTIGQDQMTFEAGPWHAFGTELLERLCDHVVAESKRPLNGSRCSLTDRPEQKDRKIGFTPDYSVVVRDDCTFLEISANHYELAYKTSQISKTTARISVGEGPTSNIIRGPLMTDRTGSQSSVSKGCSARDLDPVERVKRNGGGKIRSSSESEQTELLPRCDFLSPRDGSLFSEESGLSDA